MIGSQLVAASQTLTLCAVSSRVNFWITHKMSVPKNPTILEQLNCILPEFSRLHHSSPVPKIRIFGRKNRLRNANPKFYRREDAPIAAMCAVTLELRDL